jgi:class 3 adenylate cyclase
MDYTSVGQTTHLAARMEQTAMPGSILVTAGTLGLAKGYVRVKPLGPDRRLVQPGSPRSRRARHATVLPR